MNYINNCVAAMPCRGGSRTAQIYRISQNAGNLGEYPAEIINVGRACARPVGGSRTAPTLDLTTVYCIMGFYEIQNIITA